MRLEWRNVILTGASRGFGRHLANVLWSEGANLLLVARNITQLCSLAENLPSRDGQKVEVLKADVAVPDMERAILARATDLWPHIDGLVNNAAIQGPVGSSWENDLLDILDVFDTNLLAPMLLCRSVIPGMIAQHSGKIVNLSGGGATSARPNYSAYATAKTGLVRFSECLAAELAGTGIDVNCVSPGAMPTDMLSPGETASLDAMQKAAELVVFLLSNESNGITGRLISAVWDDWRNLKNLDHPDNFRLRRFVH